MVHIFACVRADNPRLEFLSKIYFSLSRQPRTYSQAEPPHLTTSVQCPSCSRMNDDITSKPIMRINVLYTASFTLV